MLLWWGAPEREAQGRKLVLFLDVTNTTGTTVQELKRKVGARNDRQLGMPGTQGTSKTRRGRGTPTRTRKRPRETRRRATFDGGCRKPHKSEIVTAQKPKLVGLVLVTVHEGRAPFFSSRVLSCPAPSRLKVSSWAENKTLLTYVNSRNSLGRTGPRLPPGTFTSGKDLPQVTLELGAL